MKRALILALCLIGLALPPPTVEAQLFRWNLRLRSTKCILWGGPSGPATPDPTTISLLSKIATQQETIAALMIAQSQQRQQAVQTDPQLVVLIQQMAANEDRVLSSIQANQALNADLLRQMIAGQQQILVTLQNQPRPAPVVITPQPNVVVTPPSMGGTVVVPPGGTQTLPSGGGPLQILGGPGGSLQIMPQNGGQIQSLPGPGGSITILPSGVRPPIGTQPLPGSGPMVPLPDPGGIQPLPGSGMTQPLPGTVFKTTYPQWKK